MNKISIQISISPIIRVIWSLLEWKKKKNDVL